MSFSGWENLFRTGILLRNSNSSTSTFYLAQEKSQPPEMWTNTNKKCAWRSLVISGGEDRFLFKICSEIRIRGSRFSFWHREEGRPQGCDKPNEKCAQRSLMISGGKWKVQVLAAGEKMVSHSKFAQKFEFVNQNSLSGVGKKLGPRRCGKTRTKNLHGDLGW